MAFGSMVLDLLKVPNPHEQLLREAFGGGRTATPSGGASAAQGAPGQAAPAQPDSVQSPQEIADLMTQFMERQARSQQIDRGIAGIIGAFQPSEAAQQTMAAFGVGGGGAGAGAGGGGADGVDANSMFTQIQKLRQQQTEFEQAQRTRAASILAARNAGLDEATASYLHETGQLPKTLHELQTAGVSTVTDGNGQVIAIDQRGQVVNQIGAPKPVEYEALKQGDGTYLPYDPRAGQPAGPAFGTATPSAFRQASPAEAQQYGAAAGQFGPDGRFYPINPPTGMTVETNPDGTFRFVQGPGAGQRPLTEGQSKDTVYSTRAKGAGQTLNQYEGALTGTADTIAGSVPVVGNYVVSEEFQRAKQAGDEWLSAILRKDTGAAITQQEQDIYGRTYLPRPGDTPAVIEQKRQARIRAEEGMQAGMPPEAILQREEALRRADERGAAGAPAGGGRDEAATPAQPFDLAGTRNAQPTAPQAAPAGGQWQDIGGGYRIRAK